uniref:Uncharacterized protein n=1 Tax=Sander lucioperca TaxID=283035 RepID=A0A8C9XT84_SANLU
GMCVCVFMCVCVCVCVCLLSFVAFILEEVVSSCVSCSALYFFEFVSCTAFLFTLLLLILLSTTLQNRVGITCWPRLVRPASTPLWITWVLPESDDEFDPKQQNKLTKHHSHTAWLPRS